MYPLSRLTYCAYLVHPLIMMITVTQMDGPLHLHNDLVVSLMEVARFKELSLKGTIPGMGAAEIPIASETERASF